MEPNILQTSNVSGIEKVSSGETGKKSLIKGKVAEKGNLFSQLLNLKNSKNGNIGNLKNTGNLKEDSKTKKLKKGEGDENKLAAEMLAGGLFLKSQENNAKIETTQDVKSLKNIKTSQNNLLTMKSNVGLNPKNEVDIDNKIIAQKLAEAQKVEAGDTGLKLRQGTVQKEMAATSEIAKNSPQMRGRVLVKGEEKFLEKNALNEKSTLQAFSTTDMRETDQRIKQVGLTGYGLKRLSDNIDDKDVEKGNLSISNIEAGKMNTEIKAAASEVSTLNNQNQATHESILEQVDNGLKVSYNNQLKEMKIKLQPEELGEIEVKFRIENNQMKAEFIVESQIVKEALESRFNQLKESLLERGINASEVNVFVSSENGDRRESSNYQRDNLLAGKSSRRETSKLDQEILTNSLEMVSKKKNTVEETGVNILV